MKYFAYGSNMLEERLKAPNRIPDASFLAVGNVQGYSLKFHKKSRDGSGKCNIVRTNCVSDIVYGIVFEFSENGLDALDRAEGVGSGYHKDSVFVKYADDTQEQMLVYIADPNSTDDALLPYVWYHRLVISGAEQHRLPNDYLVSLRNIQCREDPNPNRDTKKEAEEALERYYRNLTARTR
jgi:hypothetical protein